MSRQRQFAPKVNKFVITQHAAHQAMCASEIMWSFRGFGRPARYPDVGRSRPSNNFGQVRPTFTSVRRRRSEGFRCFSIQMTCFASLGRARPGPRCDNKWRGAKITEPKCHHGPLWSNSLEWPKLRATVPGMQSIVGDLQNVYTLLKPSSIKARGWLFGL